ncbi:hypothetical protein HA402_014737 [Bradysia odoriphaga]|nr:hypothetical protein HA402_014737 [Bradysia odoriphaga]
MSKKMSRYPNDCKVYVGELGNSARKNDLEDSFSYYGPLRNVWIARNPPGFAFVEFEDARDAEDAVRGLDGRTICGRRARVELSNGKSGRGFRGPPSRSRGRPFDPSDRSQLNPNIQYPDVTSAETVVTMPEIVVNKEEVVVALIRVAVAVHAAIERALTLDPVAVPDPDDHDPVKIHAIHATVIPSHRSHGPFHDDRTAMAAVKHRNVRTAIRRVVLCREMAGIEGFFFLQLVLSFELNVCWNGKGNVRVYRTNLLIIILE